MIYCNNTNNMTSYTLSSETPSVWIAFVSILKYIYIHIKETSNGSRLLVYRHAHGIILGIIGCKKNQE